MKKLPPPDGDKQPLEIAIPLKERVVSEEEAIDAMKRQGCVIINDKVISDLESVGIHVRTVGVVRIQRGRAMVNQHRLDSVMKKMTDLLLASEIEQSTSGRKKGKKSGEVAEVKKQLSVNDVVRVSQALGYLSSKLTESQQFTVELERAVSPDGVKDDEDTIQPFVPGAKVGPPDTNIPIIAQHVTINNPPAVSPPPPEPHKSS